MEFRGKPAELFDHAQVWQVLAVVGMVHLLVLLWWLCRVVTEKPKTQAQLFK